MTKGHLLNHTLYGVDIINHIVRLEYPEHTTIVKGDDCGEAPDPINRDGAIIAIAVEKTFISQRELPDRCAKVHFNDGTLPDCDAIEFAVLYYKSIGTPKTETEVISILATDLCIKEQRCFRIEREHEQKGHADKNVTVSFSMPPTHKMSFYRRPIRNTKPIREASPQDIFKYLISDYAKANTEQCRAIKDSKERSKFKASNFDYITPAGIFSSRNEKDLVRLNGYIVIDFDHVPAPEELVIKLANDINFETVLAFRSPSGDGVKWIVARNLKLTKGNGTSYSHEEFFRILSNYSRKYIRNRGYGGGVRTSAQAAVKSVFKQLTQSWKNLTNAQILAWNALAQTQAGKSVLGTASKITGANLYTRLNYWIVQTGGAALATPPTLVGVDAPAEADLDLSADAFNFQLTDMPENVADLRLIIQASAPQSNGISRAYSKAVQIGAAREVIDEMINIKDDYEAVHGAVTEAAPKVFLKYFFVNTKTGEKSGEMLATVKLG